MKINFESSTACNAKCVFCPHAGMTRPQGQMGDELFHKIIKEGKEMGVKSYSPFLMGEPFVFPKIWEWLDYMEKEGVFVSLYTNAEYLDVDRLLKYKNISYVNCSLNATTPETHKKVMGISNWEKVKKNIGRLYKEAPFSVHVSFIRCDENVNEVEEFKKQYHRRRIGMSGSWTNVIHNSQEMNGKKKPCFVLLSQMFILWDGRVTPCCMDYDGKMVLGDANKQSLKEIWNSYKWMRDKHRQGKWDEIEICKTCNYNTER